MGDADAWNSLTCDDLHLAAAGMTSSEQGWTFCTSGYVRTERAR